jgi:ribose 5-phosphate isomerase B
MKVAVASDHAGYALKQFLTERIRELGHDVEDLGCHDTTPVDYPDSARAVGEAMVQGRAERGILICGSGIGACVAANKIKGIRAGTCHDSYSAHQGVEHDDMNVLCIGARVVGAALAQDLVKTFLTAQFTYEERFVRRLRKVLEMERQQR